MYINRFILSALLISLAAAPTFALSAADLQVEKELQKVQDSAVAEKYGIRIKSLTLTANGHMLDLRYQVTDAEKAVPFLTAEIKPYLIDSKSGTRLSVPTTPKIGSLRQKTSRPEVGRQYFMIFSNSGMRLRQGSRVVLQVGDIKIEDIVVQ